jgi:hypothetical protein
MGGGSIIVIVGHTTKADYGTMSGDDGIHCLHRLVAPLVVKAGRSGHQR